MGNRRLTERRIEKLLYDDSGPSRQVEWDSDITGFGVRSYASGRKSYVLQYGDRTKRKLMALGQVGVLTIERARALARDALYEVAQGGDPLSDRQHVRLARLNGSTVADLIEAFLSENEHRWSKAHSSESRRRLKGVVNGAMGRMEPTEVGRADVNRLHAQVTKRGAPVEANRIRTIVYSMFEWAAEFGYVPEDHPNPAKRRRSSSVGRNTERSRSRYLGREEAPRLLAAADSTADRRDGVIVRLWLLTGLRRSELLHRRWSDIDWKSRELTITGTKNGKTHVVPLCDRAIELLESLPRPIGHMSPIFPGPDGTPLTDFKKPWERIRKASGLHDLTMHDLRRTVGTWLTSLHGVPITTVAALLNHQPQGAGVTAIYARPMDEAVRDAVNALQRLLAEVERPATSTEVSHG